MQRVTDGERQRKYRVLADKTSLRRNQDATLYLAQRGVVLGFQVSIGGGQKAGRAHLTIVNLHC
jgi:hypothetical protein